MVILPTFGVKESNYQPSLSLSHTIALCGSESIKRPPSIAFLYVVSSSGNPQHWQRLSLSDSQLSVTTITSNAPKWNAFMRTKWAYQHEESEHSVLVCVRERAKRRSGERCCKWEQTEGKFKTHGFAVSRDFYVPQRSCNRNVVWLLSYGMKTLKQCQQGGYRVFSCGLQQSPRHHS